MIIPGLLRLGWLDGAHWVMLARLQARIYRIEKWEGEQ